MRLQMRTASNELDHIHIRGAREHNLKSVEVKFQNANWLIDLGPNGGPEGGKVIAQGTPEQVSHSQASDTGRYLRALL